jgi:hypothetical protein
MGLCLGAACKLSFSSGRLGKMRAPCRAIHVIETLRLCAFAPPGSPLDWHSVAIVSRTVNDPGLAKPPLPSAAVLRCDIPNAPATRQMSAHENAAIRLRRRALVSNQGKCGAPRASPWHLPVRPWGGILSKRPRSRPGSESKGQ